ncbi:dTDP-4-dehydrorhamnose 3,5-epimerase [Pelagibius sp.]|uniref:dTDP-4-dehydrorhamnose 3,5-epimerase n=1 Tax=Pelagibius sp. TaxID=1931238 RepID=UPI002615EA50|nr:dTDP-4-dehydrorhamnose 3,5-epimerase [Pelagibius sp.]
MEVTRLDIPEVCLIRPARHGDHRGFFSETYNKQAFAAAGITEDFVQDNHSLSAAAGTVRGLHFQVPPRAQAKLLRVVQGAVFDVAVDLRHGSPSYGRHVTAMISAAEWNQIFIPAGFAHGFCTMEPDTEVLYKVSDLYAPEAEQGLLWNDPDLGIDWPIGEAGATLSKRDGEFPPLRDLSRVFEYERKA